MGSTVTALMPQRNNAALDCLVSVCSPLSANAWVTKWPAGNKSIASGVLATALTGCTGPVTERVMGTGMVCRDSARPHVCGKDESDNVCHKPGSRARRLESSTGLRSRPRRLTALAVSLWTTWLIKLDSPGSAVRHPHPPHDGCSVTLHQACAGSALQAGLGRKAQAWPERIFKTSEAQKGTCALPIPPSISKVWALRP